jgi:hypothetical protein
LPASSVVADLPAFGPSAILTIAAAMPLAVALSVTVPLNENAIAAGVGVGDGTVVADPWPPHPLVNDPNTNASTAALTCVVRILTSGVGSGRPPRLPDVAAYFVAMICERAGVLESFCSASGPDVTRLGARWSLAGHDFRIESRKVGAPRAFHI